MLICLAFQLWVGTSKLHRCSQISSRLEEETFSAHDEVVALSESSSKKKKKKKKKKKHEVYHDVYAMILIFNSYER